MGGRRRYSNTKKVEIDGHKFDSKRESERYLDLRLLERAGEIRDLELQPVFKIEIGGIPVRYVGSNRQMTYRADFRYYDVLRGCEVIEDVKMQSGFKTEVYKIKRALMRAMGHTITET